MTSVSASQLYSCVYNNYADASEWGKNTLMFVLREGPLCPQYFLSIFFFAKRTLTCFLEIPKVLITEYNLTITQSPPPVILTV